MLTGSMIEKFTQRISVLNHKAKPQEQTPAKQNPSQSHLLEQQHSQRDEKFQRGEKENQNIEKQSEQQKSQQNHEEQVQSVIQNSSEESDKKFIQKFTDKLNQPSLERKELLQKIKSRIALIKPKIDEFNNTKKQQKQTKDTELNKLPIKRRGRPPREKSSEQPAKTKKNTQNQHSNSQNVEQIDPKESQNVKQYKQSQRREAIAQVINQIKLLNNEEKNNYLKKKYRQFGFLSSHELKILVDSYKIIFGIQKQIQGLSEKPNEKQISRRFARQFLRYVQQNSTAKKYKFRKICTYVLRGLNLNNFRPDVWLNKFMNQNKSALKGVDLREYSQKKTSLSKDKQPYEKVVREMEKRKGKELEVEQQQKKQEKQVKKSRREKIQKEQKNELKRLKKPVKIEINSQEQSGGQKSEKQSEGSVYTKKSKKSKRIIEKKMEKEKQRNLQKQVEQNIKLLQRKEIEKQKQRVKQKQIQKQIQKEIEKEKQKQKIKQRELQKELQIQKQKNRQKERQISKQRRQNSKAKKNTVSPPQQLQIPKSQGVKKQFIHQNQINKQDPSSSRISKMYPQNFRKKIASKLDSAVLDFFQNLIKNKSQQFCVEEDILKQIYEQYAQFNRNGSRIENNNIFLEAYTIPQQYEINQNPEINEQDNEQKVYNLPEINQYENNIQEEEEVFETGNNAAETLNSKPILNVQKSEPYKNSQNMNNFSINPAYNKKPKENTINSSISQRNSYSTNVHANPPIIQSQKVQEIKPKTVNPFEIIGGRLMHFLRHNSNCTEKMIKDQAVKIVTNSPDMLGKIKEQSIARWLHTFIQRNRDKIRQSKTPNQINHPNPNPNPNPKIAERAKIMIKPPISISPSVPSQPSNYRPFQQSQSQQKPQYPTNNIMQNGHTNNRYENNRSFQIAVPRNPPRTDMKGYIPQNGRI